MTLMKRLQTNLAVKFLAVVLAVACGTAAMYGGVYVLRYWDSLFGRGYTDSGDYFDTVYDYRTEVFSLLDYQVNTALYGANYIQKSEMEYLEEHLAQENTNFRYVVRSNSTGQILLSNTGGVGLEEYPGLRGDFQGSALRTLYDEADLEEEGLIPAVTERAPDLAGGEEPSLDDGEETAQVFLPPEVVVEYSVVEPLAARDEFWTEQAEYQTGDPVMLSVTILFLALTLVLMIFLGYAAGHKKGVEGIHLNWQDRIPYDLYLFLQFWLVAGCVLLASEGWSGYFYYHEDEFMLIIVAAVSAGGGLVLAALLSTVARCKARALLRNTLLWRFCAWVGRGVRGWARTVGGLLPMAWRFVLAFLAYLLINAVLAAGFYRSYSGGFYLIGLLIFNGAFLYLGCRWVAQWKAIRAGAAAIVGGDPSAQIDTNRMFPDLRAHAEALNNLGDAINSAVEQRMKSEHFKAELITNVSHDLKTPLTSIINYVDLLKKTGIQDPKALEYIEVLDRKSQRLKKLTEDLVEASKASTGNVAVDLGRMDLAEFTQQAVAEYQDRLDAQRLTLITKMPEEPVHINADGRHMWRVLDNLLGNCVKYALEGTRVYLEVVEWDGKASISLKNISREPLEGDPERLTERFVRGDESRTTEGSGLGLSIARSLTEVQGGTFRIATDGDLFKATVYFPAVE